MRKNYNWKSRLVIISSTLFLILFWHFASGWLASPLLIPSPEDVLEEIYSLIITKEFYLNLGVTIWRGLLGAALSLLMALWVGMLAGYWPLIHYAFLPILLTIRSTPVISLILLALIWFGSENVAIFIAFLTMFPLMTSAILDGIRNIDADWLEMAKSFKVSRSRILLHIYIPGIAPFFFNGASNAMGFGWRAIIIGEVLSQPWLGMGSRMKDAQNYLKVSELIAWTIIAIVVGSLAEFLIRRLEKKMLKWRNR